MIPDTSPPADVVRIASDWTCSSATLAPAALRRIESALRRIPWYRDRWSAKSFRVTLAELLRTSVPGGLVLIGPRTKFDVPPPFEHLFEPIELGSDDDRLKTLSGAAPTRQERIKHAAIWTLATIGFLFLAAIVAGLWFGLSRFVATFLLGVLIFVAVLLLLVRHLAGFVRTWYLMPGSVAIVRRLRRGRSRITILTRFNACGMLRYVYTGKVVMLMLELISLDGRREAIPVSDREASSFLAAWRSPHPPPEREQLSEFLDP